MNQVVIPFRGWDLIAWANAQPADARIAVRPICEHIGIAWQPQHVKLTSDSTFSCHDIVMTGSDGKQYEMVTLPVLQLNRWLCGINANRVKPEIAPKLMQFQDYCMWAIYDALSGKVNAAVLAKMEEALNDLRAEVAILRQENKDLWARDRRREVELEEYHRREASVAGLQLNAQKYRPKLQN
jgi:hypothetical protein